VVSRADLKSDLLQELERQKRSLSALHNNPAISEQALDAILAEIERASADLLAMTGKLRPASARKRMADGHQATRCDAGRNLRIRFAFLSLLASTGCKPERVTSSAPGWLRSRPCTPD